MCALNSRIDCESYRVSILNLHAVFWAGVADVEIHLVDGTYELFRHYYALPSARDVNGREVAAVRGVVASVLGMIKEGATHVAVATDHVIESFRNDLWPDYIYRWWATRQMAIPACRVGAQNR